MKLWSKLILIFIASFFMFTGFLIVRLDIRDDDAPNLNNIEVTYINEFTKKFNIKATIEKNLFSLDDCYCYISTNEVLKDDEIYSFSKCNNNICSFSNINFKEEQYIYFKDKNNNISDAYILSENIKNEVLDLNTSKDIIYLIVDDTEKIKYDYLSLYDIDENEVFIYSEDETIAVVEKDIIRGIKPGTTNIVIKINDLEERIKVVVTNLINKPKINNKKPFLPCNKYNYNEAKLLDELLKYRIEEAGGEKTRAGVVAAARFLLLEFPYRINYFPENGRLNTYGFRRYVDGEGRYYHKGLYLSKDKFSSIKASATGPVIWGCPIKVASGEIDQPSGHYYSNGLDCSGFVTWAIYNGGYDIGDIGAGFSSNPAISNLGKRETITTNLLKKVKAGDVIGVNGHAAIIIGIDQENKKVYVAETLFYNVGTTVLTFSFNELVNTNYFTYIIRMDNVYKKDGNYTNMW